MPSRTAKFVSAVFVSVLAGAPLTTVSRDTARAAEECLSGPKDYTPQGSHWYYRIDRATKHHCWYLREEGDNPSQSTPAAPLEIAKPIAPKAETPTQRSIADAHAELPLQARIEQPNRTDGLTTADIVIPGNNGAAGISTAETQRSVVASRWPDPSDVSSSTNLLPSGTGPVASASPASQPQPSVLAAGQRAAIDASANISAYSAPTRLAGLTGALAFAAIAAGIVFKLAGRRRSRPGKIRARRGPVWEPTDDDAIVLSDHPGGGAFSYRAGFARSRSDDRNERIANFFEQISKRAPG
jgi:hypothetical protein